MKYYRKSSHSVYDCTYHIVWITKYRYPVLVGDIGLKARERIQAVCRDNQVEIIRGNSIKPCPHICFSTTIFEYQQISTTDKRKVLEENTAEFSRIEEKILGESFVGSWLFCQEYRKCD